MFTNKIFKRDNNGNLRFWQAEVQGDAWRSHSGIVGGAAVASGWTTCVPRSRPTGEEQAMFEAEAELGKKLDKDYAVSADRVDEARSFGAAVMLAHKFEGTLPADRRAFSQPKIDGIRCKTNRHGMWTRNGKPILAAPHIFAGLAPAFANNPDLEIDGELYNHELKDDFNKISSLIRKLKPTDEHIAEAARLVQYHIYDLVRPDLDFSKRDAMLDLFVTQLDQNLFVKMPTIEVHDMEQIDRIYGVYLEAGYEGQMLRIDGPYETKRSKLLLKRKDFITREFPLIAIEEGNGNWAGYAKRVRFRLDDGRECGGGIRGTQAEMRDLLARADSLVGKPVTVRYFVGPPVDQDGNVTGSTDVNKPRFPVAVDFDRVDPLPEGV